MKRTITTAVLAGLTLFSVGCCYRAGGCDPATGMMYAGQWQPACYGPLDPFGMWCGCGQPPCCPNGPMQSPGVYSGGCCPQPGCGTGYPSPTMPPQTFATPDCYSNGMPSGVIMPGEPMTPTPAPGTEGGNSTPDKKSTLLVPQPMSPGTIHQGAQAGQWVKAF